MNLCLVSSKENDNNNNDIEKYFNYIKKTQTYVKD